MPVTPDATEAETRRRARLTIEAHTVTRPLHAEVAERLDALVGEGLVLDVGCGDGPLARWLGPRLRWLGIDRSPSAARLAGPPSAAAMAGALPVASGAAAAVTALWALHEVDDPLAAMREANRALRPGGAFMACTARRDDSPELLELLDAEVGPSPFDAEDAPELVASVFGAAELRTWDEVQIVLPDAGAVRAHLEARGVDPQLAAEAARAAPAPLPVTRRGVLVWALRSR